VAPAGTENIEFNTRSSGNAGNDTILGSNGDDFIATGVGADSVEGGTGNDFISAASQNGEVNRLFGQGGNDTLTGSVGDGAGDDLLDGGIANDSLGGRRGDNVLIGGRGEDTIFGGGGADQFTYTAADQSADGGEDLIQDFNNDPGDVINLAIDGLLPLSFIGEDSFTDGSGATQIRYQDVSGFDGVELQVDTDDNGDANLFILLEGVNGTTLSAADFISDDTVL
jgi:Ca2+-binding RTX toxin-like protein